MAPSEQQSLLGRTLNFGLGGTAAGALFGMAANATQKPPPGVSWQAFLRADTLKHAGMFGSIAAVFAVTDTTLNIVNGGDNAVNSVAAGCIAGSMVGVRQGSFQRAAIGCGFFGSAQLVGMMSMRDPKLPALLGGGH